MSWDSPFDRPVPLPNGALAQTLRDAANYIKKLPKSERHRREWRLAIHLLIEAADDQGPMTFARMGILLAIERSAEPHFGSGLQIMVSHRRRRTPPRGR